MYIYELQYLISLIEGSWDEVMRLIGQAHTLVHQNGVLRVQTDIRAGTRCLSILSPDFHLQICTNLTTRRRTDKKQHFSEKVSKVESILAADVKE